MYVSTASPKRLYSAVLSAWYGYAFLFQGVRQPFVMETVKADDEAKLGILYAMMWILDMLFDLQHLLIGSKMWFDLRGWRLNLQGEVLLTQLLDLLVTSLPSC